MQLLEQNPSQVFLPALGDLRPKRKVLFLIDMLLGWGGAESALRKMVTYLPEVGYSCAIASFRLERSPEFLRTFPCPVYDLPLKKVYNWEALQIAQRLRRLVASEKFDVIHTMFPSSDLWGGPIAKLGSSAVLVSGRRDLGIVRSPKHDFAYRWLRNQYDQVQAVSDAAAGACIARDGLSRDKVFTVHNGIEIEHINGVEPLPDLAQYFGLNNGGPTVVTSSGQLWHYKGIDVLIRAAAVVCKQIPNANFIIAGWSKNAYGSEMEELIRSLGLENNVKLIGRVPIILSILKSSDVFCLLSRSEGLSNALLEAMACGLPCVATSIGGNSEVVENGRTGYLVPADDVASTSNRIVELLQNPNLRKKMGQNGKARVNEHFSVQSMVSRMAKLYDQLLDDRKK